MATVWLTYAWEDNKDKDVDFIVQELEAFGVTVKLDRWNLNAGTRLWEQIAGHITNPDLSNAWLMYATQNSLGSEACKEEFSYALDRALNKRGKTYPVIALFSSPVDRDLIPAGIRTRLFVSTTDHDWKERIKAAAEGRQLSIDRQAILPYDIQVHTIQAGEKERYAIEVRPRAGTWSPFLAAIPIKEKDVTKPRIIHGPKGHVPMGGSLNFPGEGKSADGAYWIMSANNEASPTQSYFISCDKLPSALVFGVKGGSPQYRLVLSAQNSYK